MKRFTYQLIALRPQDDYILRAADTIADALQRTVKEKGFCTLGLSGGSTPAPVYTALGKRAGIDWARVAVFLVDERFIPSDHIESNQRLVRETLLTGASIPEANLIFPDTSLPMDVCVDDYEERLQPILGEGGPDVVVLGMGEDGHIASLFPGDSALAERDRLVVHTTTEQFAIRDRLSVTVPVLTGSHFPIFLLRGEGKRRIFTAVVTSECDPEAFPAHALLLVRRSIWVTQW